METNDSPGESFVKMKEECFWSSFYREPTETTTIMSAKTFVS